MRGTWGEIIAFSCFTYNCDSTTTSMIHTTNWLSSREAGIRGPRLACWPARTPKAHVYALRTCRQALAVCNSIGSSANERSTTSTQGTPLKFLSRPRLHRAVPKTPRQVSYLGRPETRLSGEAQQAPACSVLDCMTLPLMITINPYRA